MRSKITEEIYHKWLWLVLMSNAWDHSVVKKKKEGLLRGGVCWVRLSSGSEGITWPLTATEDKRQTQAAGKVLLSSRWPPLHVWTQEDTWTQICTHIQYAEFWVIEADALSLSSLKIKLPSWESSIMKMGLTFKKEWVMCPINMKSSIISIFM